MTLDDLPVLPQETGCYLFYNAANTVIYVGKAINLRSRVRSYFSDTTIYKAQLIRQRAVRLEFITCQSETEALILEANLIKRYQPHFNVRLKDDKHYPFLKLSNEAYPMLMFTRRVRKDGAQYFGPYPNPSAVRRVQDIIASTFPLRQNSGYPMKPRKKPCLRFHMGRCLAPCIGHVDPEEYAEVVGQVKAFLEGRVGEVVTRLEQQMRAAAKRQEFELARLYRDRSQALQRLSGYDSNATRPSGENLDFLGVARAGKFAMVQLFQMRNGRVIGRDKRFVTNLSDSLNQDSFSDSPQQSKLSQDGNYQTDDYADYAGDLAKNHANSNADSNSATQAAHTQDALQNEMPDGMLTEIPDGMPDTVPDEMPDSAATAAYQPAPTADSQELSAQEADIQASSVQETNVQETNVIDDTSEILERFMADYYAQATHIPPLIMLPSSPLDPEFWQRFFAERSPHQVELRVPQRGDKRELMAMAARNAQTGLEAELALLEKRGEAPGVQALQQLAQLEHPPYRIEGFDISNLMGTHTVASIVVFEGGRSRRSEYRTMRIRGLDKPDDFFAMRQAVARRFSGSLADSMPLPDLLLIDGGKGQLSAARQGLRDADIDIPLLGLAKKYETIVRERGESILVPHNHPALRLLINIRDEAHRTAVGFNRKERGRASTRSILDDVSGIGPKRRDAILAHFSSIDELRHASLEHLASIPGVGSRAAEAILEHFRKLATASADLLNEDSSSSQP